MKIITTYNPTANRGLQWEAVREDYDGAPDSTNNCIGFGSTEVGAILDLHEIEKEEIICHEKE